MTLEQAKKIVAACEADMRRALSRGEVTDLLLDNWDYGPDWMNNTVQDDYLQARKLATAIKP